MVLTMIQSRSLTLARTLRAPSIRFRYGPGRADTSSTQAASSASASKPSAKSSIKVKSTGPLINDWELAPRFQRRLIDEKEIELINSGGAI